MKRHAPLFVLLTLSAACGAERHIREPEVTTTAAVVETTHAASSPWDRLEAQDQASQLPEPVAPVSSVGASADAQIAGIAEVANEAAVGQATLALRRAKDTRVRDFAQLMYDRHREAKLRLELVMSSVGIAPAPTSSSAKVEAESRSTLASLSSDLPEVDFDRAYVESQLKAERALCETLDRLIPTAQSVDLERALMDLRPKVDDQMRRAFDLQQILANR